MSVLRHFNECAVNILCGACCVLTGLALSGLDVTLSDHDKTIQGGTNTIQLKAQLVNKGTAIKKPEELDLFKFKLYISRAATLDEKDGAKVSECVTSVHWHSPARSGVSAALFH